MNTTMEFLAGNHTLDVKIRLRSLTWLTLLGDSSSLPEVTSRIVCTWPAGFVFKNINELQISALAFVSCGTNDSGAVYIGSVQHSHISNCAFQNNSASYGGALAVHGSSSRLRLTDNTFQNNHAHSGGALAAIDSTLSLTGNTFQDNSADSAGGAIAAFNSQLAPVEDTTFENNKANYGGGLYVYNTEFNGSALFTENSANEGGGSVYAYRSIFLFKHTTIVNNSARDGGGLLLSSDSKLYIGSGIVLHLTNNSATRTGGAIKVEDNNPYATCTTLTRAYSVTSGSGCFFQLRSNTIDEHIQNSKILEILVNFLNIKNTLYFANNSAVEAGADLYGGFIDRCLLNHILPDANYEGLSPSGYVFNVTTSSENIPDISSDPLHLCTCRNVLSAPNCSDSYHSKPAYPGGTIEVPVTALG